ncbi:Hsp70 family protein [Brevundimonas sp.]|uniref:Hsp70 family protein n=1 Tax=Brevundimonas sp. TaxID=1871086 RepID=UPI00289FC62F|nr:Hsp70 family protein [Brevundimonas sp.]
MMYLGIDLGTSNSAVVGYDGETLRVFKTAEGADVLPTALFINPQGRQFVGKRAYEQAALNPDNVALGFKRLMGTSTPLTFAAAASSLTPEAASAEILRTLLAQAELEAGGERVRGTVITMPAAFNQMQTEATLRAAELAGVRPLALLHEPIAAAMGSMASSRSKDGQFLVYDLGGGTFDAALVQSAGGVVNVVANEGINMLGGRDHDRALLAEIVLPWLERTFDLGPDYQLNPTFARMLRRIQLRLEEAKIELTTRDLTQLFIGDEELRIQDRSGADIYVDVEINRARLEDLVSEDINRSIDLCARMIRENGYRPEDIDRVVLIGGPSKMPIVRSRVPEALGIAVDLSTDPMTAVARGAAIYAESREWGDARSTRKASRATEVAGAGVRFDFPARTSEESARLRISGCTGHRIRIDAADGWTSGEIEVADDHRLALPLSRLGENLFRVQITRAGTAAETVELRITQTAASAAGVPLTHTLAIAVEDDGAGVRRDRLHCIADKGAILPLMGVAGFRAGRTLVGGAKDRIDIGFFETLPEILELDLARSVGAFQLRADRHLETGQVLRTGDRIEVHWQIDENGIVLATIVLPDMAVSFDSQKFYSSAAGHRNFAGDDGDLYLNALVTNAADAIETAEKALSHSAWVEVDALKDRLSRQEARLSQTADPEVRRQAAEELHAVRQDLHRLTHADEHRVAVLNRDLATLEEIVESTLRGQMDSEDANRFDQLAASARQSLDKGAPREAETPIEQMRALIYRALLTIPDFLLGRFEDLAPDRAIASDKPLHDKLVEVGRACIRREDWEGLRQVTVEMQRNFVIFTPSTRQMDALSGLLHGG